MYVTYERSYGRSYASEIKRFHVDLGVGTNLDKQMAAARDYVCDSLTAFVIDSKTGVVYDPQEPTPFLLDEWEDCRTTVLATIQEAGLLGAGAQGFDPNLCAPREATWALRRPGEPPYLLFSRLVDDDEESPSGYAFVVDVFEVEPTGQISGPLDFPDTFWDATRADEILGDSYLVTMYEDPSLPALPVPEQIADELWYGDAAVGVLRMVAALGLDLETECPEEIRPAARVASNAHYLLSYGELVPVSSPETEHLAHFTSDLER